ncbi:hypothetical protein QUA71_06920 [Microcoleus sp. MON1_C5]|uniref:hypothetical protein n=1 Tax=Microcoleus sp. MON1_C5 TaxID=2818828 RepID=UPI002FD62AA1
MASPRNLAIGGLLGGVACYGLAIGIIPANRYLYQRQGLGVAAACLLIGGYVSAQRAIKEQIAIDRQIAEYEKQQQLIKEATQPVMLAEAKNNAEVSAEMRQQLHTLDAGAAFAHVVYENHPAWAQQQIEAASVKPEPEHVPDESDIDGELPNNLDKLAQAKTVEKNSLAGVELPTAPNLGVRFFDWKRFKKESKLFPHVRAVGATGIGKTCIIDWLLDVFPSEKTQVITVKCRVSQWQGLKVVGVPEDFDAIRSALEDLQSERKRRTQEMAAGVESPMFNVAVDEWRVITKNVKAITDRASKEITSPSARDIMGNMITLAREVNIRMFVMAQGRQVETWGLEGESDLAECFCSIYLGKFAVAEAETIRNRHPSDSQAYRQYQSVRDYLETLGSRAAWISCAEGEFPAIVPDLSGWTRPKKSSIKLPIEAVQPTKTIGEDLPAELLDLARQRLQVNFGLASSDTSITSENTTPPEASEASVEVREVRNDNALGDFDLLPVDERSKALTRLLSLLSHNRLEVIELIPSQPDKALWLGIKTLKMRVTPASQKIFGCGTGGANFQKAQGWYKNLENRFGKIIE